MSSTEHYRAIAAELEAKANAEPTSQLAAEWQHLARCYLRLAEQADQNSFQDFCFEYASKPPLKGEEA